MKQRSDFQTRFASLQTACSSFSLSLVSTPYLPEAERNAHEYVYPGFVEKVGIRPYKGHAMPGLPPQGVSTGHR